MVEKVELNLEVGDRLIPLKPVFKFFGHASNFRLTISSILSMSSQRIESRMKNNQNSPYLPALACALHAASQSVGG